MKTLYLAGSYTPGTFSRKALAVLLCSSVLISLSGCNTEITEPSYPEVTSSTTAVVTESSAVTSRTRNTNEAEPNYAQTTAEPVTAEEKFEYELSLIPFEHLLFLRMRGWRIELTTKNLAAEYDYPSQICGITDYNKNIIYISSNPNTIRRATIHEVGHAIAYELGWVEETDEFVEIFESEKEYFTDCCSIGDGHEISDKYEYFASVYQNMILDYSETKAEVPMTVEYIEDCLSRISIFDEEALNTGYHEIILPG